MHTKLRRISFSVFYFVLVATLNAQTFSGTNVSGLGTNYTFTMGTGATNLSLVLSNSSAAYSYLLLKKGGTPASDTDFDFIARLDGGPTNQINLESPEFTRTNYGLRVLTPLASANQAFTVRLTTNRTDLRSAGYPVLKPLAFSTTGNLTNTGSGSWHYFQVDMPTNLPTGWRVVLSSTGTGNPDLYLRRGQIPDTGSYEKSSLNQGIDTIIFDDTETTNATYFIGVYLPAGAASTTHYTLSAELSSVVSLTWDSGTTDAGTGYTNQSASGGDYYFSITTSSPDNAAWRTALTVSSGEAEVYLLTGALPSTISYNYSSTNVGSDGFVLSQTAGQFDAGQNWYYLVHATPGAQWKLVSGAAYVQQLPPLAANASSGANVSMGAEGMHFFKTTITTNTLAWRLWLTNGISNQVLVKKTAAPVPFGVTYDWTGNGQMLLVPPYLNIGDQYIVGVVGAPNLNFTLDSRQQAVTDIAFGTNTSLNVTGFGYQTYRVQVPIHQIAWEVSVSPSLGNPNVAIRRDNVPNEYVNDAFSELPGSVSDSVTLVPPTLSDGTFYITVYGSAPYTCALTNSQPIITDVPYVFQVTNDATNRVGWRYYRVVDITNQLGSLGWDLELANQFPNTLIALRPNAVPGQWNFRNCPANCSGSSPQGFMKYSGADGFLQRPGHQADIWYIGVYQPAAALGPFVLSGALLTSQPIAFDGSGAVTNIVNQRSGKWQYLTITVPTNAFGWDLRISDGAVGDPRLVVCRDLLPESLNTSYGCCPWYPSLSPAWPSGARWAAGYDWTGDSLTAAGSNIVGHVLAMGMGNPLEPGTYYAGILSGNPGNLSYQIVSRGIGTNLSIPIRDLVFTNGVVSSNGLPVREAAYYRLVVPSNAPSWRFKLGVTSGDALVCIQKDRLPNVGAYSGSSAFDFAGGKKMQKAGDEWYFQSPTYYNLSNIIGGTYYLAVVSEGQNPGGGYAGTGTISFTLTNFGVFGVTNIGTLDRSGANDLRFTNSLEGAEEAAYRFTVPSNTLAMEVWLENRLGNPTMTLRADNLLPGAYDSYGNDGGVGISWSAPVLINIANPVATNYTLMVRADSDQFGYTNASYRIRVHALVTTPVDFASTNSVVAQPPGTWRYFQLTVPTNVLGWDLRLTDATNGDPRLVVRRDLAPDAFGSHDADGSPWYAWSASSWPTGYQWAAGYDWTVYSTESTGSNAAGHVLAMGMGNPLAPGNYLVGVINANNSVNDDPMSYTLVSRGIGGGYAIPVLDLPFTNGIMINPSLIAREVAYYRVIVPTNLPSWSIKLGMDAGEGLLMLQKDFLPNVSASGAPYVNAFNLYGLYGGKKMQKPGDERYLQLPLGGETNIVAGTYYLAVASEGMNPEASSRIGTNDCAYTLTSFGLLTISNLGSADITGTNDLVSTQSNEGGENKAYQFTVPPGTFSIRITLENRTANPVMALRLDEMLPASPYSYYGIDGGQTATWYDPLLINIASPTPTNYTLMVQAANPLTNADYTIRIHAQGPLPLAFDGGPAPSITNQPPGNWQYFLVTVPATNVMGWDLRLTDVTSGDPRLVVRRGLPPNGLSSHDANGGGWGGWSSTSWPTGYQWAASSDWTGYSYDNSGSNSYGHVLQMGMGNPLEPGDYYVGVLNGNATQSDPPMSYTLVSRGIGTNLSIPVNDLLFTNGMATNLVLNAREVAYYRLTVPTNVPSWKMRLTTVSGESLLMIQKDALPNVVAGQPNVTAFNLYGGRKMQKAGNEQYLELPLDGVSNIVSGTYYLAVASEGINPTGGLIGSVSSSYELNSFGLVTVSNLGPVGFTTVQATNLAQGGESQLYQFSVPPGAQALEVRLDDRVGDPAFRFGIGPVLPYAFDPSYGDDGGTGGSWSSRNLVTVPNVVATNYSLSVQAGGVGFPDASYTLRLRQIPILGLNFDPAFNTNGLNNVVSNSLTDGQSIFYQVIVPSSFNGQPVLGWRLNLAQTAGLARVRVRKDLLPEDGFNATSGFFAAEAVFVTPYLTPGTWFVEVRGTGGTDFTLTSRVILLDRIAWDMPAIGQPVTTPGLTNSAPLFADTGVTIAGTNSPGDQGTDLGNGNFHYYAVTVPANNVGLLRTRLDAISGNPNLYIRSGGLPTPNLYDRGLSASAGSQYGNWVPMDGRYENCLTPGTWYFAVQANGNSNVRYRLRMFTGTISSLAANGVALTNQTIVAGDWRSYAFRIPTNAPASFSVTFNQIVGDAVMYLRDTTPPGQGSSVSSFIDWNTDSKNHGPYPSFDPPGTYTFNVPPARPGALYYLGFRAVNDATFTVSCTTNSSTIGFTSAIPFYAGSVVSNVPAHGTLKLRIDVPAEARRLILGITNAAFNVFLDQGSVPTQTAADHWSSLGAANASLNEALYLPNNWPWLPGNMYFLFVTNTTGSAQTFSLGVDGRNCVTDDFDNDGLQDCWELTYWPGINSYGPNDDPDNDGVSNLQEFVDGTDPTDPHSMLARLTLITNGSGSIAVSPLQAAYFWGTPITLTATPNVPYNFSGWSGTGIATNSNPLNVLMTTNRTITALFIPSIAIVNPAVTDAGHFYFTLIGPAGPSYQILASTNLTAWSLEATLMAFPGAQNYTSPAPVLNGVRFYRARSVP